MRSKLGLNRVIWLAGAVLALVASQFALAEDDPSPRVARVSAIKGQVTFAPAGEEEWYDLRVNRPIVVGDRVWSDRSGRVELEIGGASLRMDQNSSVDVLSLDGDLAQFQLNQGSVDLHVRRIYDGQVYEIATPTIAFVAYETGHYRVDLAPDGVVTRVIVYRGEAEVWGEDGVSERLRSGESYRFHDSRLDDFEILGIPRRDSFARWVDSREKRYARSTSVRYVSHEVIGYADLDEYGTWDRVSDYGHVWFPRRVVSGWAPYRHGHWAWIEPWGWSWVDDEPWGFAPFHYGRWVHWHGRWGWVPGPSSIRPVYSPALVAFVGGSNWNVSVGIGGGPVGWFPLGPRDVYIPPYWCSRDYFSRINYGGRYYVNNTTIINVYNDYSHGRWPRDINYAYRTHDYAVTVVPRTAFQEARSIARSRIDVSERSLRDAPFVGYGVVAPTRSSLAVAASGRSASSVAPPREALSRNVVARHQPAQRIAPFAAREAQIRENGGRPLKVEATRELSRSAASARSATSQIRVVGTDAKPGTRAPVSQDGQRPSSSRDAASGQSRGSGATSRSGSTATEREPATATRSGEAARGTRGRTTESTQPAVRGEPATRGSSSRQPVEGEGSVRGSSARERGTSQDGTRGESTRYSPYSRESGESATRGTSTGSRGTDANSSRSARPVDQGRPSTRGEPAKEEEDASRGTRDDRGTSSSRASQPRTVTPSTRTNSVRSTPRVDESDTQGSRYDSTRYRSTGSRGSAQPTPERVQPIRSEPTRSSPRVVESEPRNESQQRSQPRYQVERSQPRQDVQRVEPATRYERSEPVQRSSARSEPSPRYQRAEPAPSYQRSEPAPSYQRSEPAPRYEAPKVERSEPAPRVERDDSSSSSSSSSSSRSGGRGRDRDDR